MIYRPNTGAMWDPSVLWHDGKYHAFMMYNRDGSNGLEAQHCLLATSEDGLHWRDECIVIEERQRDKGWRFFKCFVGRCGDRFIMDHGVCRPEAPGAPGGQDIIRFYESGDLKNWSYISSNGPDARWYTRGRWDHMYILPKADGDPGAGFLGYPVACPNEDLPRGCGMMQSTDGCEWKILPPPEMDWGRTQPRDLEIGGCERIGDKYYLIGGTGGYLSDGYSMYTLVADDPFGPFRPDVEAYRLCGTSGKTVTWLAAWCRGKDQLLISNYASMQPDDRAPWMLPLRKVTLADGHLRLGWWQANEALKGASVDIGPGRVTLASGRAADAFALAWLGPSFDLEGGVVIEGTVRAAAAGQDAAAGFVFAEGRRQAVAVQLGIGKPTQRQMHIGTLVGPDGGRTFTSQDVTAGRCATVNGIADRRPHTFRLLVRMEMFELYIDDLLAQTYAYIPSSGKIGFVTKGADAQFSNLNAWRMTLS